MIRKEERKKISDNALHEPDRTAYLYSYIHQNIFLSVLIIWLIMFRLEYARSHDTARAMQRNDREEWDIIIQEPIYIRPTGPTFHIVFFLSFAAIDIFTQRTNSENIQFKMPGKMLTELKTIFHIHSINFFFLFSFSNSQY